MGDADRNFVVQQGLDPADAGTCTPLTSALLFQPRIVGLWVLLGAALRSGWVFAAMAAALFTGSRGAAIGIGIAFLFAVAALVFGRLCLGSFVYHLLRGRVAFAVKTLPWGPGR